MIASSTVIAREMRAAARQPFTYHLRMLGVAALLAVCAFSAVENNGDANWGARVFPNLHAALLISIWVLVPLLTADCISRERREHTLPLLFLTPLKPHQIVQAKGMANGLRAITLCLAALPVLTIAFVAGGVSWLDVVLSVVLSFSSICLAMAAGLLASAYTRVWMRALALAGGLALLFFFGFIFVVRISIAGSGAFAAANGMEDAIHWALDRDGIWQNQAPYFRLGPSSFAAAPLSLSTAVNMPSLFATGMVATTGVLTLLLAIHIAALQISETWRENPPSAQVLRVRRKLTTPVYFTAFFHRWMRWELNRNPVGWLERRSWSARLVTWSWLAVFVSVYSSLLANLAVYHRAFDAIQSLLAWLLILAVAVSSAGSFRRERETGVLELLMVSPLRERQIIGGRLRGLWTQFMPAIVLLVSVWLYLAKALSGEAEVASQVLFYGATLLTLPVVGLYNSLARSSFPMALLGTLGLGVFLPVLLAHVYDFLTFMFELLGQPSPLWPAGSDKAPLATAIQLLLTGACAWRLLSNLKRRKFALDRQGVA